MHHESSNHISGNLSEASMKILTHLPLALLLLAPSVRAKGASQNSSAKRETPSPQSSPASDSNSGSSVQSKIDPAKEADIRQLLDLSDTRTMMTEIMETLEQNMALP